MTQPLTHLDEHGHAHMVNVSAKPDTHRIAIACGEVHLSIETLNLIQTGGVPKGDVFAAARLAGIMAAKRTDELIPMCHSLGLDGVDIGAELGRGRVRVTATVRTRSRTGVEMEALAAVAVACLTVVDMGKSVDRAMVIEGVRVLEKRGGRSGAYKAKRRAPASR